MQIKKKSSIVLIALFVLILGGVFTIRNSAYANESEFYFFVNTGVPITELVITENTTVFIDGILASDEVNWKVGDDTIITANQGQGATGKYSIDIICNKPGTTTISGTVGRKVVNEVTGKEDILYTPLTLKVTVKLKINNYTTTPSNFGKMYHLFEEDEEDQGSLVLAPGEKFDLKLMVGEVRADDLSWYCDYDENTVNNIVSVNESGQVTAINPGIAKVGVNTYKVSSDNNQTVLQTDYIYVVVKPNFVEKDGKPLAQLTIEDPTTIYTNARIAKNLTWVVRDNETKEVIVDTYIKKTSDLVKLTPSSVNGSCEVDFKAGSYTIEVFPTYPTDDTLDLRQSEKYPGRKLEIIEYVEFMFPDEGVYVGDEFDLYQNSNVADLSKFKVQGLVGCDIDTDSYIAKFTQPGDAIIKITPLQSMLPIRAENAKGWLANFTVSTFPGPQSYRQEMNVGETFEFTSLLGGITPDRFESVDPSIAKVNVSGKVTALKGGTTTIKAIVTTKGGVARFFYLEVVVNAGVTAKLDKGSLTMAVGDTESIRATYTPNNLLGVKVKWVISNTDKEVLQIISDENEPGYVNIYAKAAGTVTLVLQDQNSKQLAFCNITVKQPITEIWLDQKDVEKTLRAKKELNQFTLNAKFKPSNPTDEELIWTSSDTNVATVVNGLVTYKKAGTTTIRVAPAYQANSSKIYAECRLTVYQQLSKIDLTDSAMTVYVGDPVKLSVSSYLPTQYVKDEDLAITWTTSNDSVVRVDSATGLAPKLTAVGTGTATITAKTTSGVTSQCKVTVYQYPTSIKLNATQVTLDVGKTYTPTVTLAPKVLTDNTLSWESSNTDYVEVSKDGVVKAKAAGKYGFGEAIVTVTTANGLRAFLTVKTRQQVEKLELSHSKATITKGKTLQLKATITPNNAAEKDIEWKSSDKSVASVSKSGLVKGLKGGSTLITATSKDTGEVRHCLVTVQEKVTKITLNRSSYVLGKGDSFGLKATVKSNYASNQKLKWTTSNKKIATVNSNGKVVGKGYGYVTITVKATDGSGAYATCRVRVVRQITKISLNKSSTSVVVGRSVQLKATIKPSNATIKSLNWKSSDEKIAYVDSRGRVTGVAPGTVRITVSAQDNSGIKAVCIVTVVKETPVTSITIVNKNTTMLVGESQKLNYVAGPSKTSDTIRWYCDDNSVATIDSKTGKIKAKKPGTVTVTVAASSGKSYETKVTIVGLSRTSISMEQYDTYTLKVLNGKKVQWDVENTKIARVNKSGKISARKKGTTYVTAQVNGRKLRCKVQVKNISKKASAKKKK